MKIGILGTGMVGRIHAAKLIELGHDVLIGTQDPAKTLARTDKDMMGNVPFGAWHKDNPKAKLATMADAAAHGELVINALNGHACVPVLKALAGELRGKDLIDISNPLDFSKGMPPTLFASNDTSLGEQIQAAIPGTHVVKALNTMNAFIQVDAKSLANGAHSSFVCGDDAGAKERVTAFLKTAYGWEDVIDLGGIANSRGPEMFLPLWLRLWGSLQIPSFSIKVVR
jgi:predicted dinucleotide-binding enzyme